jgi:uncharacterized protein (TIGR02996 family)
MRSFTFTDGKSDKFWNIELKDNAFTVTFGRRGTTGQTQTKTFADAAKAKAAHDKLVQEKVRKGYVETSIAEEAPLRKQLEAAILENPDNAAPYAALADYLIEQGDPRGEFIQVQLALEDESHPAAERKKLKKREAELLKAHGTEWVGPWASLVPEEDLRLHQHDLHWNHELPGPIPYHFVRGYLAQITLNRLTVDCARALVQSQQTRSVWRLAIGRSAWDHDEEFEPGPDVPEDAHAPALHVLLPWPGLANLHFFQLGHEPKAGHFNCHTISELACELVERMPRLEELHLFATRLPTANLFRLRTLQNLRVLRVYHSYHCDLERLARNPALRQLTHLLLHPHATEPDDECYIRLSGVQALVKSQQLKNLTHLQLRTSDMGDRGCEAIVQSGILKRLRVLDLRQGSITDEGACILAACPEAANLEVLDLLGNKLTEAGIRALRKVNPRVQPESESANEGYHYDGDIE